MTYDMCKFERGQVWMVRFKHPEELVGHEQKKDRPWLVLSVGKFNKSSGMVTMAPITTRDNIRSPSQVLFSNDRGVNNVILCENVRTFDHSSGAYIFDYMGTISDEILEKVDVAISIHLGLHYSPITLNKLYDSMESIIKSVGYMQQKADTPKFTDDDVLHFAEKLHTLAGNIANDEISDTKVDDSDKVTRAKLIEVEGSADMGATLGEALPFRMDNKPSGTQITLSTAEYDGSSITNQDTINNVEVKTKRIKWTPEICKEFLHDADTLPMKKVMEKWSISKKTRFYSMKNYAATLLEKIK